MQSSSDFIAYVNRDQRAILYRCRSSSEVAAQIVPELIRILSDEGHLLVDESLRALFLIGTPALAAATHVIPLISSPFPITRQLAVLTLGQIALQKPEVCVQPIARALDDEDCCQDALRILAFLGSNARNALPAIVAKYETKEARTRSLVVKAVAAIDGRSETARELFGKARADRSKDVRSAVEKALKSAAL